MPAEKSALDASFQKTNANLQLAAVMRLERYLLEPRSGSGLRRSHRVVRV
jgi:hypothetical protein